jgi:hypothetical protein
MLRFVRFASLATFVCAALLAGPASADPANKNAEVLTFDCTRGTETISFQAVGIFQSNQISGQLLDGTQVVVFVYLQADSGQIFYQVPGQLDRPDLWTCTIREFPGGFGKLFLTPLG